MSEHLEKMETRLLRGFADFNFANDVRIRKLEADVSNVNASTTQRLGYLEPRVTDLDFRLIKLEGAK
jgi:hypothetical protein